MAEKHLVRAILRRFKEMPAKERVAKVRRLANESAENRKLIQNTFPDLYHEAFTPCPSEAGARWESTLPHALDAKRR